MNLELTLRWAKAGALIVVASWEVRQVVRHRDNVQLKVLTTGLVLLACIATLGIQSPALRPIVRFFGPTWSPVVNGCWMAMACAYAVFFGLVHPVEARPMPAQLRRARREVAVLIVAIGIQTLVTTTAPPGTWHHPRQPQDYLTWRNIVFVLSVDGYALAVWFIGTARALRYRSYLTYPWMKAALALVISGASAMALGVDGVSLLTPIVGGSIGHRPASFSLAYSIGQLGGQVVLACGLLLIPVAGAVVGLGRRLDRIRQRRYARELVPLWHTLCTEFPSVRLDYGRRAIEFEDVINEIGDALAELGRYAPYPGDDTGNPRVAAAVIASALRSVRQHDSLGEVQTPPYVSIEPELDGWKPRARWMLNVSRELSRIDSGYSTERHMA